MTWILAAAILLLALIAALATLKRYREERKQGGLFRAWPVPKIELDALDPRFVATPLGPLRSTETYFIANFRVPGGISDLETWILCVLARDAQRIFEFGTCTGKTAYLMARNAPADARVITLTLSPAEIAAYQAGAGDAPEARDAALQESRFDVFFYQGTEVAGKIEQLFGDSKVFDETPYLDGCDLIFVDGSHARSYVESDSRKALRMVKPGGLVLWDDYWGPRRAKGVFQALNALSRELPLVHIAGTNFVAYRRPND